MREIIEKNRSGVPVVIRTLYTPTLRVGDRGGKNERQEYPQTPSSRHGEKRRTKCAKSGRRS
jgi:hypothetical protein